MLIAKPEVRAIFADEPNIRPWSDLGRFLPLFFAAALSLALAALLYFVSQAGRARDEALASQRHSFLVMNIARAADATSARAEYRSEESRGGKAWVRTCRSRWSPDN